MTMLSRALAGALVLLSAVPAVAQDETQTFNAFAVVLANGSVVRAASCGSVCWARTEAGASTGAAMAHETRRQTQALMSGSRS